MNLLLKFLFISLLIVNNRFTYQYAILLKPAYFGLIGLIFYYIVSKYDTLTINSKDSISILALSFNIVILIISGLYNTVSLEIIIYGIFPYLYILMSYLLFNNRKIGDNHSLVMFSENLIVINAVICYFQGIYLLVTQGEWQDLVTGIHPYGTANELGYVFLIGILVCNFYKKSFYKSKTVLYIMTLFLMEAKGAILLLILSVVIIQYEHIRKIKESLVTITAIALICFGMFCFINWRSNSVKFKADIFEALEYESSYQTTASASRIAHLFFVINNYFNIYHLSPLLGSGIGTYESPAGYFSNSKYLYLKNLIFWNKGQNAPQVTHTQFATLLAEGGYLGLLSFEISLITMLISFKNDKRRYSFALLTAFFIAQVVHYIFLTFLTFMLFWPMLFTILKEEREALNESS
jgi:hypothetical protein